VAERVDLVEEQHAGRVPARRLEQVVQVALGAADPHVQHVGDRQRDERRAHLARHGPGQECLAAAGRAVEQQAAAQALAEQRTQLGVAQWPQERHLEALLDLLHAAHVGERDRRPLDVEGAVGVALDGVGLVVGLGEPRRDDVTQILLHGGPVDGVVAPRLPRRH
jgi:hypothetical protein